MYSLTEIIGRNRQAVERLLGPAEKIEAIKVNGPLANTKAYYQEGSLQIIYIDQIADWIIVDGKEKKLIEDFIHFLGVRFTPDKFKNLGTAKYYNIAGLAEVAFYGNNEGNIESILIKAFTILK